MLVAIKEQGCSNLQHRTEALYWGLLHFQGVWGRENAKYSNTWNNIIQIIRTKFENPWVTHNSLCLERNCSASILKHQSTLYLHTLMIIASNKNRHSLCPMWNPKEGNIHTLKNNTCPYLAFVWFNSELPTTKSMMMRRW